MALSTVSPLSVLTWDGDDRDALVGNHPWGAAVLHIEMSRLETPPDIQRNREREREMENIDREGGNYALVPLLLA